MVIHGKFSQPGIPGGSTLIFEIELLGIGGGYYHFDFVSNRILLDRESYDFGRPKWHLLETLKDLCKQSDQGRAPSTYRGLRLVYFYDDDSEFDVSRELQIDYYD